ncbi:MAG: dTDP-glucose 4,6-dehydratase [Legionellaceae bacterium]
MIFVTGGAGFIGSNFILDWFATSDETILNIDKLTYAGNLSNLSAVANDKRYIFTQADINDAETMASLLNQYQPRAIIHFAAESHVDRSIMGPKAFIETNINGTFNLLEMSRQYWNRLSDEAKANFRFIHVSTDEVYGSLDVMDPPFTEGNSYEPNSPYAASKAASDHLARAYYHTYNFPVIITHCSNNYGPYQFPEKLIPLVIYNALHQKPLPIYGDGLNIRDWLYVTDHCSAIRKVLNEGKIGDVYNIGGWNEKTNIEVVKTICTLLDELRPAKIPYASLISYVTDRQGHDRRYAINASKIKKELDWVPAEQFETGLRKTIIWYLNNEAWINSIITGEYRHWIKAQYGHREE